MTSVLILVNFTTLMCDFRADSQFNAFGARFVHDGVDLATLLLGYSCRTKDCYQRFMLIAEFNHEIEAVVISKNV